MAAVDRAAVAAGMSVFDLMEAAGRAVAAAIPGSGPVAVLCGPGNNGGDGYVAARVLAGEGHDVEVYAEALPAGDGAAARHAALWRKPVRPLDEFRPSDGMIVIDALFGAGLGRPITGAAAQAILHLNAGDAFVIAVDVPSGLDADTGQPTGPTVEANQTVTFFRAKPGHLLWPGRCLCGTVTVAEIGLTEAHLDAAAAPRLWRNGPALWAAARPGHDPAAHKYQRGHCLVVSGPELRTGAARLAATAALNAGAGAVTIAGSRAALMVHAAHVTAIMLEEAGRPEDLQAMLANRRFASAVIGPAAGVGEETLRRLEVLTDAGIPAVVDADALTALAGRLEVLSGRPGEQAVVLTPHAGEFTRLFGGLIDVDLHPSKVEQARAAAGLARAIVVLKGVDTVIAAPDGRAAINANAGPELATAGSGDVLSGLIAAELAQGLPPFEAAAAAVYLHGYWGACIGPGLTADRLVDAVRPLAALPE